MSGIIKAFALLGLLTVLGAAAPQNRPDLTATDKDASVEPAKRQALVERGKNEAIVEAARRGLALQRAEHERVDRERRNLAAQESVAGSTATMVPLAAWQLLLSIIGVAGLGVTLYYAHQSSEHARRAVEVAADTGKRQLRAYVVQSDLALKRMIPGEVPVIEVIFKNSGQTPALNFQAWGQAAIHRTAGPFRSSPTNSHPGPGIDLGADCVSALPLEIEAIADPQFIREVQANILTLTAQFIATYEDIYGEKHALRLNVRTLGNGNLLQTVLY